MFAPKVNKENSTTIPENRFEEGNAHGQELKISTAADRDEQEAESIADEVTVDSDTTKQVQNRENNTINLAALHRQILNKKMAETVDIRTQMQKTILQSYGIKPKEDEEIEKQEEIEFDKAGVFQKSVTGANNDDDGIPNNLDKFKNNILDDEDPEIIQSRSKYKSKEWTISKITKDLGPDYDLQKLKLLFFGNAPYDPEGWRNNIIRYYLVEQGWQVNIDEVPQWVEYKFVYDDNGGEYLVVFTPIPGELGRKAAFGFVRWDLGFASGKKFYRYQGNKEDYLAANTLETLEEHLKSKLNQKSGTTTKEEIVYKPGYTPIKPKSAIVLAYELAKTFESSNYIKTPGKEGEYINHHENISIADLLRTEYSLSHNSEGFPNEQASRRDYFINTNDNINNPNKKLKKGSSETIYKKSGTTLGVAKKKFIDNNKYSYSELEEEGLAANNFIQHFNTFKAGVGKAIMFIHIYGTLSSAGKNAAHKAISYYKEAIVNSYLHPLNIVNFSKADAMLEKAYATVHTDVYGKEGIYAQSTAFANEAYLTLQKDKNLKNYSNVFNYLRKTLDTDVPTQRPSDKNLNPVDLNPLVNIDIAIGVINALSQLAMLNTIYDSIIKSGSHPNHVSDFRQEYQLILMNISWAISSNDIETIKSEIEKGKNIVNDDYIEKIKIDNFLAETNANMKSIELQFVLIALSVATMYIGGVAGTLVNRLVTGSLAGTTLSTTSIGLIAGTAEVTTAALTTTVLMQTFEAALTEKKWGEGFGKEFAINFVLFGVFKLVEVAVIGRSKVKLPSTATQLGEGVWKDVSTGKPVYYVEKEVALQIENEIKTAETAATNSNKLAYYPEIRAKFAEVQTILKSRGTDPHLIENGLRNSEKSTLEFFEKNPEKLIEAAEKLPQELKLNPLANTNNAAKFLDKLALDNNLLSFTNNLHAQKLEKINSIWNTKYQVQEMLEGRSFFEDIMGHYRYSKSLGWNHTGDIANNFKGVDFYIGTIQGNTIYVETAVSMKTTITTNVDNWIISEPIKKNIKFLNQGKSVDGLLSNGKTMFINNAEIHIYMPKANITESLKNTWMNKLNSAYPNIKFEINAIEDFI